MRHEKVNICLNITLSGDIIATAANHDVARLRYPKHQDWRYIRGSHIILAAGSPHLIGLIKKNAGLLREPY